MKREILFRGKRIYDKKWIFGDLEHIDNLSWVMIKNEEGYFEVIPETLGQFTGLTDKNGSNIFEGDIVETITNKEMEIRWNNRFASFSIEKDGWGFSHFFGEAMESIECEITGNIHDKI